MLSDILAKPLVFHRSACRPRGCCSCCSGLLGLGGVRHRFRKRRINPTVAIFPLPVARLAMLFATANWPHAVNAANLTLFATSYFIPPTKPTPATATAAHDLEN